MAKSFSQRGLTFKQIALTLLVTLLVGGAVTLAQSWLDLESEKAVAQERMSLMIAAAEDNAAAAAFRLDADLAEYVARGLAATAVIARASIVDESGVVLASSELAASDDGPAWLNRFAYDELHVIEKKLFSQSKPNLWVGTLIVHPDRGALSRQFLLALKQRILLDGAKALLLAIVLSVLFYFALTRPMLRLSEAVRQVTPGKDVSLKNVVNHGSGNDEFSQLITALEAQLAMFSQLLEERHVLLDDLRLRNVALASMDSGVLIVSSTDQGFPIVDCNAAICELLGVTEKDLIGQSVLDFVDRDRRSDGELDRLESFITSGLSGSFLSDVFEIYSPEKTSHWCKISIVPVPDESGQPSHRVVVFNDITKARETEEKLRHSQKMDALGKVAGGIAHDFNNMLAIMRGNLELATIDYADEKDLLERLDPVMHGVDRAAELTRRLLRFSRKVPLRESTVCIDDLIRQMEELLRSSLTPEINIHINLSTAREKVRLDTGDFEDALLNLAVNAKDAMPEGGVLTLKTEVQSLPVGSSLLRDEMKPGDYVCMTIADTGLGMDSTTIERLFEPFYTTKEAWRGTGLGLSQVYGFVERSGGNIRVQSRLGEGSTFSIYVPLHLGETEVVEVSEDISAHPRGDETILLVDDEPELVSVAQDILERLGYTVLVASGPEEAARQMEMYGTEIDLLLSDVVMPGGVNGHELADFLRTLKPGLKVLMASGYESKYAQSQPSQQRIAKPYSIHSLATSIRDVLDAAAT